MKYRMISSIEVLADETFCYVNHTKEPLNNKFVKSVCSLESSNMNQLILVGGIPSNSCDNSSSVNTSARATKVAIVFCNAEDGREMR